MSDAPKPKRPRTVNLRDRMRAAGRGLAVGGLTGAGFAYMTYRNTLRRITDPSYDSMEGLRFIQQLLDQTLDKLAGPRSWEVSPKGETRPRNAKVH